MDFTRDPIIETIISPKDGFKLSVRSSRYTDQDEYLVNALEVVSFGSALFFRSIENPKPFLLPVSDYEVVEVKEARMVFKNVSLDKPIKIGEPKPGFDDKEGPKPDSENKKNSKKKNSRKRRSNTKLEPQPSEIENQHKHINTPKPPQVEGGRNKDEVETSSSVVPIVFPTPPKIIGRKLPSPPVEEIPERDFLPDELVSDSDPLSDSIEEDTHHEKEISNLDDPIGESPREEKEEEDRETL